MRLMGRWNWWLPRGIITHRGSIHRRNHALGPDQINEQGAQWVP
jgi:hypothetical protein